MTDVTSIFLHACESWTLTAELQRRIQGMEMRCYREIICTSYKDHVINKEVHAKIQQASGPHEDLIILKRRKLQLYRHVSCSLGLAKTALTGTVKGGRRRGKQKTAYEICRSLVGSEMCIRDSHSRAPKKNTSHRNEVLPQDSTHFIQRPCYQRDPCQDPAGNRTTRRPPDTVKRRKLQRYGHVTRSSGLAKTILQGTVKGGRRQGR